MWATVIFQSYNPIPVLRSDERERAELIQSPRELISSILISTVILKLVAYEQIKSEPWELFAYSYQSATLIILVYPDIMDLLDYNSPNQKMG